MRKRFTTGILTLALVGLMAGQAFANHVVQPGETLWMISQKYKTTVSALVQENNLANPSYIEVGQRLAIPGQSTTAPAPQPAAPQVVHTVRAGETLWLISRQYNTTVAAVAAANRTVNINIIRVGERLMIPGVTAPQPTTPAPVSRGGRTFSAAELDLFARIVFAESAGEPFVGQVAVAATILNRVDSSRYPNTLSGVVYQVESGFYQYSPVLDGRINLPANDSARRAVAEAISGADPSLGATGFFNPSKTTNQIGRASCRVRV